MCIVVWLCSGTRYMVVDCGGGTVDITVYEMESKYGHLRELHKATGGPYGSLGIYCLNRLTTGRSFNFLVTIGLF